MGQTPRYHPPHEGVYRTSGLDPRLALGCAISHWYICVCSVPALGRMSRPPHRQVSPTTLNIMESPLQITPCAACLKIPPTSSVSFPWIRGNGLSMPSSHWGTRGSTPTLNRPVPTSSWHTFSSELLGTTLAGDRWLSVCQIVEQLVLLRASGRMHFLPAFV